MKSFKCNAALSCLLVTLFLSAVLVITALTGCGDEVSTISVGTTNETSTTTMTPTAVPMPEQPPGTPTVAEQELPYNTGTTTPQIVGTMVDGLQLLNVRWADHGSYYRVVFDLGTSEGEPVMQVPHAEASLEQGGTQVKVLISGVRSIGDKSAAQASELNVGDELVISLSRFPTYDDQLLGYTINLSRPATYSLAGVGSPGRIIIDVMKG